MSAERLQCEGADSERTLRDFGSSASALGENMAEQKTKVTITFTQQQMELLDKLRQEGTFGTSYPEIVAKVFREAIRQQFGEGGVL